MRLPKKVKVDRRTYRVRKLSKARREREDAMGYCTPATGLIQVATEGLPQDEVANTLLHEILHACWDAAGLADRAYEEKAVSGLADKLCSVLKDNPTLLPRIAKALK